jgi:hypothetical protein
MINPDKELEDRLRHLMDLDPERGEYAPTWVWVLIAILVILGIIILARQVF